MTDDIDEEEEEKLLLDALEQGTLIPSPRAAEQRIMLEQAAREFMRQHSESASSTPTPAATSSQSEHHPQ